MRARSVSFALDFLLKTRHASWVSVRGPRTAHPRFGPLWRLHVPRIWNRSINGCKFPVKRKTLNVVDKFPSCLFVVVPLQGGHIFGGGFLHAISPAERHASNSL